MLVPNRRGWLYTIFHVRGSSLVFIWGRLVLATVVAIAVTWLHARYGWFEHNLTTTPFTLVGLALSIFLGFRNNTSYDRYWEGRRLWGSLVNTARSITRQILTLIASADGTDVSQVRELQHRMVYQVIAYVHALRHHLRDETEQSDLESLLPEEVSTSLHVETNRPVAILASLGQDVRRALSCGWLHPLHVPLIETSLVTFTDIQGGCERIKSTPIPFSYNVLLHRTVAVYCFALPFGLVSTVGGWTSAVVAFVAYTFFSLDAVGEEIENPFGLDINDLPLAAISRAIERDARCRLGEVETLPPPLIPSHEVLN